MSVRVGFQAQLTPTTRYFQTHFSTGYEEDGQLNITSGQQSLIVSILSIGTFVGALLSSVVADGIGRRKALMVDSCMFIFGNILQTASTRIPLLLAGRFFAGEQERALRSRKYIVAKSSTGFGVGLLSATIPLYQAETAPKWMRGSIIGCYQLCITIGMFTAGIVNNATKDRNDTGSYRIPIAVQFLFALIIIFGSILLPETPRQLVRQGKYDQAAKSLSRLRRLNVDHPAIVEELAEIRGNHEYELSLGPASYLTCFRKPIRKRLISGICLQALQQLTGVSLTQACCISSHTDVGRSTLSFTMARLSLKEAESRTRFSSPWSATSATLSALSLGCTLSKNGVDDLF